MNFEEMMASLAGLVKVQLLFQTEEHGSFVCDTNLSYVPQSDMTLGDDADFFIVNVQMMPNGVRCDLSHMDLDFGATDAFSSTEECLQALKKTGFDFLLVSEDDNGDDGIVAWSGKGLPADNMFSEQAHAQRLSEAEDTFQREVVEGEGEDEDDDDEFKVTPTESES